MAANGPYNAVTALRLQIKKQKNDSNHRHWRHFLADDTTVTAGWMALGGFVLGDSCHARMARWSHRRFWGSLYWSYSTNPGWGLWILHDHSDWKAMGFESLTYFLSPVILWTCAMFFVFFNLLMFFWQKICVPNPLLNKSVKNLHWWGILRGLFRKVCWNSMFETEEDLQFGTTSANQNTHALYGGLIVRFKPLKFHIFWDTWG